MLKSVLRILLHVKLKNNNKKENVSKTWCAFFKISIKNTLRGTQKGFWPASFWLGLKGIQFLLENDLLQNTPEDIAQFLYKGEGLNKTVIGDYLGERWVLQLHSLSSSSSLCHIRYASEKLVADSRGRGYAKKHRASYWRCNFKQGGNNLHTPNQK